ncbi:MAG: hypothetical protein QOE84_1287 [Actinomycetota bacterium]|jgi:hypothetical protein|nr:hypothetical protein [Actinomycetota bacterium]
MGDGGLIEVAGPAQAALDRAAELRDQGWSVCVRGSSLNQSCEVVWTLAVDRAVV